MQTVAQFAKSKKLSKARVYVLIEQGRIAVERVGKIILIPNGATIQPPLAKART
jgi:hypothetical protein